MNYKKILGSLMEMISIVVVSGGNSIYGRDWCRRYAKKLKREKVISNDFIC